VQRRGVLIGIRNCMVVSIVITGGVTCVLLRAISSATYSYNLAGEMTELMWENGVRTVTGYDAAGRQTGVTHQIGLSVLDGVGYGLDSMGRRTSITRPGGQNDSYGYDAAGQVTAGSYLATPSGNQSDGFAYDAMGNRTTSARNGVNVSYSANALEQYSAVGGEVPIYDAGGNALSLPVPGGATVDMTWDAENRMLSSTRNGAAVGATVLPLASSLVNGARVVNRYDVLHRRVVKEVHAPNGSGCWTLQERRLFTYDGWNVIEERAFDAGGSLVAWQRLTWGRDASGRLKGAGGVGGLLLAEELPVSGVGSAVGSAVGHYPGYDGNGNVVLMTTGSGVVEGRWRYGAFGGTLGSVTASGGSAERQPWRFSGKYLDGEVETRGGVYYYGYRHYVPEVGRWASRDPIGERGGVNLYGMVWNGVVNTIDYLGLVDPGFTEASEDPGAQVVYNSNASERERQNPGATDFFGGIDCSCACDEGVYTLTCSSWLEASITLFYHYSGPSHRGVLPINLNSVYGHEQQHIRARNREVRQRLEGALAGFKETYKGKKAGEKCDEAARKAMEAGQKVLDSITSSTPPHSDTGGSTEQPRSGYPYPSSDPNAPPPTAFPFAK